MKILFTSFLILLSINTLAIDKGVDKKKSSWDKKYSDILKSCIFKKNYKKTRCQYNKNNTPLDVSNWQVASEGLSDATTATSRGSKTVLKATSTYLVTGGSKNYWQNVDINNDYDHLLKLAKAKATNEALSTC